MELKKYKLGEVAEIRGRIGFRGYTVNDLVQKHEGAITFSPTNISDHTINYNDCDYISFEKYEESPEIQIFNGDILFTKTGSTFGKCAYIEGLKEKATINPQFVVLKNIKCNPKYLYYVIRSEWFQNNIKHIVTGSTIPTMSQENLKEIEIFLPSSKEQQKIATILSSLDRKIALNRRINSKLETIAKRLYDYWFVQFDFPDENGNPYKSSGGKMVWNDVLKREIPEGWVVKSIFDACNLLYGFPYATEPFDEENLEASQKPYKVVRIRDIQHNSYSAKTTEKANDKYRTQKNDLLVGMDGYFHMNFWFRDDDYVNQRIVRLRKTQISTLILYHQMKPFIKFKEEMAKGSTVGHLSDKDLKQLFVVIPNDKSISNIFDSILNLMTERKAETARLTALRDKLLPLLMNGQVEVA